MKLVIDIPYAQYQTLNAKTQTDIVDIIDDKLLVDSIKNGTPLPKGHGDLVSKKDIVDIIKKMPNDNPSYWNSCDVVDRQELLDEIASAPTIIEADMEV